MKERLVCYVSSELKDRAEQVCAERGMTMSNLLAQALSMEVNRPYLPPLPKAIRAEILQLIKNARKK